MGSRDYFRTHMMNSDGLKKQQKEAELVQTDQGRLVKNCLQNTESVLITAANEPSLALYRIQEHVRKSVVQLVERKEITHALSEREKGAIYDTDYAISATSSLANSLATFKTINTDLKNAIHLSQQISHDEQKRSSQQRTDPFR